MASDRKLFEVYALRNGFVARFPDGSGVIGKTVDEACVAARAEITKSIVEGKQALPKQAGSKRWGHVPAPAKQKAAPFIADEWDDVEDEVLDPNQ